MKRSIKSMTLFALIAVVVVFAGCENLLQNDDDGGSSDGDGEESEDTTPPAEVDNLSASSGDGEVTLTWTDSSESDFDHVEITWSPEEGDPQPKDIGTGTESATITGLTNGTSYTFTVKTVDGAGNLSAGLTDSATPETRYGVTYFANGADSGQAPSDPTRYTAGGIVTVLDNSKGLSKADHTFAGWNTKSDQSGTSYTPGETLTMPSYDLTLYAVWNPETTVTVSFENPHDPNISFSGAADQVSQGNFVHVSASSGYSGYTWYLDGSTSATGLSSSGADATIDTGQLSLGTHTMSVVLDEGYSAQFSFDVVN